MLGAFPLPARTRFLVLSAAHQCLAAWPSFPSLIRLWCVRRSTWKQYSMLVILLHVFSLSSALSSLISLGQFCFCYSHLPSTNCSCHFHSVETKHQHKVTVFAPAWVGFLIRKGRNHRSRQNNHGRLTLDLPSQVPSAVKDYVEITPEFSE